MIFKMFKGAKRGDSGTGIFKAKGFAIAPNMMIGWVVTDVVELP